MGSGGSVHSGPIQKAPAAQPGLASLPVQFTPPPAAPSAAGVDANVAGDPNKPDDHDHPLDTAAAATPPITDRISKLTVASSTVKAGSSVAFQVTLAAAGTVKVTIVRHVPASGHGKHRRKAHDVTLGSKTFTGRVGRNTLKLLTLSGHKLAAGRYTAKLTGGGRHAFESRSKTLRSAGIGARLGVMSDVIEAAKAGQRMVWAAGSYPTIAQIIAGVGELSVQRAGVQASDDVLDVAAGDGNVAIPAAATGATVTALDLTPELIEAGRARAAQAGVELTWVQGDAEALPYPDASFDKVLSDFGAMFAPRTRSRRPRWCASAGRAARC